MFQVRVPDGSLILFCGLSRVPYIHFCPHRDIYSITVFPIQTIFFFIFQASVNINIQSHKTRSTALHMAAEISKWSVVECLIGWGAALNLVDQNGNTPLHCVIETKSFTNPESPQIKGVHCSHIFLTLSLLCSSYSHVCNCCR